MVITKSAALAPKHLVRLDDLLVDKLGEFGLYQKMQYFLVGIPSIFAAMHALSWTFAAAKLNHRCLYPGENASTAVYNPDDLWYDSIRNLTTKDGCKRVANLAYGESIPSADNITLEACADGYVWDHSDITYSAVDRWTLTCDRDIVIATVQALYFIGQLLGSIVFGLVSDKIGRKPCFIIAILMQIVCGACLAAVPNVGWMTFLRAGSGFAHPGVFLVSVVIGAELVGPSYRMWSSVLIGVFWAIGIMILGALSYPLRDYRYLQLAISLPAIVLLVYWFLIPESARWLMSQGRFVEVDKILNRLARWNKRDPLPQGWYASVEKEAPRKLGFLEATGAIFRSRRLCIRTSINCVIWAVITMSYYGLAINPGFMGGDKRLGFILGGLLEIPGLIVVLFVNYIGRKFLAAGGFLLAALCLVLTLAVPEDYQMATLLLVIIGKSALTAVFSLVYIWTPEHYPTMIRNTATGAASMFGRVGGIAASYFSLKLANDHPQIVASTFAGLAALAGVLSFLLPETTGEPLLETIEEAELLGIDQPMFVSGYRNQILVKERLNRKKLHDVLGVQSDLVLCQITSD